MPDLHQRRFKIAPMPVLLSAESLAKQYGARPLFEGLLERLMTIASRMLGYDLGPAGLEPATSGVTGRRSQVHCFAPTPRGLGLGSGLLTSVLNAKY